MSKLSLGFAVVVAGLMGPLASSYAGTVVPCEDMLQKLSDTMRTATLSETDKAAVQELKQKAIRECKRDHDAKADDYFQQAIDIATGKGVKK